MLLCCLMLNNWITVFLFFEKLFLVHWRNKLLVPFILVQKAQMIIFFCISVYKESILMSYSWVGRSLVNNWSSVAWWPNAFPLSTVFHYLGKQNWYMYLLLEFSFKGNQDCLNKPKRDPLEIQHQKIENSRLSLSLFMRDTGWCNNPHASQPQVKGIFCLRRNSLNPSVPKDQKM